MLQDIYILERRIFFLWLFYILYQLANASKRFAWVYSFFRNPVTNPVLHVCSLSDDQWYNLFYPPKDFSHQKIQFFKKVLTLSAPGFWVLVIPRGEHKVPGFNLRVLDCCLTLKLCVCFQKYKLTSHEKKNSSKSQKVSEILRFEIFLDLRFHHDLNHKNGRNSRNFLDRGLIFYGTSITYDMLIKESFQ